MKRLFLIGLFILCVSWLKAQTTNGVIVGTNYMNYDHTDDYESYEPGIGVSMGYRFYWQLSPKWDIGTGLSVNKYNIVTTYYSELHTHKQIKTKIYFYRFR